MKNKPLEYLDWLQELKETPSAIFQPVLNQFLKTMYSLNGDKLTELRKAIGLIDKRLDELSSLAIIQMEALIVPVGSALKKEGISLEHIQIYHDCRSGKGFHSSENLAETLYHALRLSIESLAPTEELKVQFPFFGTDIGYLCVDYDKFCKLYPAYADFQDYKAEIVDTEEEILRKSFQYLDWANQNLEHMPSNEDHTKVIQTSLMHLKIVILYFLSPGLSTVVIPLSEIIVPGLFSVTTTPYGVQDIRAGVTKSKLHPFKGKTQPYCILRMVAEQYQRNTKKGEYPDRVELAYEEIIDRLKNTDYCTFPMKKDNGKLPHDHLTDLLYEVKKIIKFTENQVKVTEECKKVRLVFLLPKSGAGK